MAMTPSEKANFENSFNELRGNLSAVTENDKSENTRALWGIVWMLAQLNQDLIGIYNELDFTNKVTRTQTDAVSKQLEEVQKKVQEDLAKAQKDAPKNWEEFQKSFTEAYNEAREQTREQMSPEARKQAAENLRDLADRIEKNEPAEDLSEKLKNSNLHPIENDDTTPSESGENTDSEESDK